VKRAPGISAAHEIVWLCYLSAVVLAVAVFGFGAGGREHRPILFVAIHGALIAVCAAMVLGLRSTRGRRTARAGLALGGLPVVFSSAGLVLPGIHPEPYEWTWIAWDRAICGGDPTAMAEALLSPWVTEVLQWCYAGFYFVPMAAIVGAAVSGGGRGFDRALTVVVVGFLASYLGYFVWPTLPPYRFLAHEAPLEGVWLFDHLHRFLDLAEANRWDCFPSGHTMLSVVSLVVAWRGCRPVFWLLLLPVVGLVVSTIALRYHYLSDVLAGLAGVVPALWVGAAVSRDP
jgi:membrane-associated phospholipid phosphatase